MEKRQIILGGVVLLAGVGGYILYKNSKKTKPSSPLAKSSLPDDTERKKLYDEIYLNIISLIKNNEIQNDRIKGQISGFSMEEATAAYKRVIASNPDFKGDAPDAYKMERLANKEGEIVNGAIKFYNNILPELDKMPISELKLYSDYLIKVNLLKYSEGKVTYDPLVIKELVQFSNKYPKLSVD
jgi:hypothetical protein